MAYQTTSVVIKEIFLLIAVWPPTVAQVAIKQLLILTMLLDACNNLEFDN